VSNEKKRVTKVHNLIPCIDPPCTVLVPADIAETLFQKSKARFD